MREKRGEERETGGEAGWSKDNQLEGLPKSWDTILDPADALNLNEVRTPRPRSGDHGRVNQAYLVYSGGAETPWRRRDV